jgi:hypothetical protein
MINSPNVFRELEYTLKITRAINKTYVSPRDILKMATTNVKFKNNIKTKINKSIIQENNFAELFITKKISKNPYLSLINRFETKNLKCLINKDKLIYYN